MTKQQIKKSKIFSPGLIGGEIVHFLSSDKGLFFMKHDGQDSYLKDDAGKYVKMDIDNVIDARLLYLSTYADQEKEEAVKDELEKMQQALVVKARGIIAHIKKMQAIKNGDFGDMSFVMTAVKPTYKKDKILEADTFFNKHPDALEIFRSLEDMILWNRYDDLYHSLEFEFGKPLATFKNGDNIDFTALKNILGADYVHQTVTDLSEKGTLYLQAKIIVEKRYHPETV